jgi:hypothetical protein
VGSPAKVIRSAPDFPRRLSDLQRAALVAEMMSEFDRYVTYEGTRIDLDGAARTYLRNGRRWRLVWRRPDGQDAALRVDDTLVTEVVLDANEQQSLTERGVHWLDLAGRSRSENGSALTEELASFLGRYGIRLPRTSSRQ